MTYNSVPNKLTKKQEKFCVKYAKTRNASEAYRYAYNVQDWKPDSVHNKACNNLKNAKVAARIKELLGAANRVANKKFCITVEQRLEWLQEVILAGLETMDDSRRQNLAATNQAIVTLNSMLGTAEESGKIKPVKIDIGVKDASRS